MKLYRRSPAKISKKRGANLGELISITAPVALPQATIADARGLATQGLGMVRMVNFLARPGRFRPRYRQAAMAGLMAVGLLACKPSISGTSCAQDNDCSPDGTCQGGVCMASSLYDCEIAAPDSQRPVPSTSAQVQVNIWRKQGNAPFPPTVRLRVTHVLSQESQELTLPLQNGTDAYRGSVPFAHDGTYQLVAFLDNPLLQSLPSVVDVASCGDQCSPDQECLQGSCVVPFALTLESPFPGQRLAMPVPIKATLQRLPGTVNPPPQEIYLRAELTGPKSKIKNVQREWRFIKTGENEYTGLWSPEVSGDYALFVKASQAQPTNPIAVVIDPPSTAKICRQPGEGGPCQALSLHNYQTGECDLKYYGADTRCHDSLPEPTCDLSDYCDGTRAACPDSVKRAGTYCGYDVGPLSLRNKASCWQELRKCDGLRKQCPISPVVADGEPCAPADGPSDGACYVGGLICLNGECIPLAHKYQPQGVSCHAGNGTCDATGRCIYSNTVRPGVYTSPNILLSKALLPEDPNIDDPSRLGRKLEARDGWYGCQNCWTSEKRTLVLINLEGEITLWRDSGEGKWILERDAAFFHSTKNPANRLELSADALYYVNCNYQPCREIAVSDNPILHHYNDPILSFQLNDADDDGTPYSWGMYYDPKQLWSVKDQLQMWGNETN